MHARSYADTEAVRVLAEPVEDITAIIHETWQRYRIPIAITETHLGCTREEQLRWLSEVWQAAERSLIEGVDIRAVTAWALLGSYDWNSLLTSFTGHYESGAFDVRGPTPRPTAIAKFIRTLAHGENWETSTYTKAMPLLQTPGWWHRDSRLLRGCAGVQKSPVTSLPLRKSSRPLLITGARGTLGIAFARLCEQRGIEYVSCPRTDLDIANPASIRTILADTRPWAVINAAGYVRVDDAERDRDRCFRENVIGPRELAVACAEHELPFVTFSSDLVFDGEASEPYVESQIARPLNVYGSSKAEAERVVLEGHPLALVIRTSAFFGPWDQYNFPSVVLRSLLRGQGFTAINDLTVSPTYVPDLVNATLDLLIDGEAGVWHLVNRGAITWSHFAHQVADRARVDSGRLVTASWRSLGLAARRPSNSALSSERGVLLPSLDDALDRYLNTLSSNGSLISLAA